MERRSSSDPTAKRRNVVITAAQGEHVHVVMYSLHLQIYSFHSL